MRAARAGSPRRRGRRSASGTATSARAAAALAGGPSVDERVVEGISPEQARALEEKNYIKGFWTSEGYAADLIRDLQHPHDDLGYIEAVQFCPGVNSSARLREVYRAFHTSGRSFHDALVWRRAALDGRLGELIDALRSYRVVLVGPPEKASFGAAVGLPSFEHVEIHATHAFADRHQTLMRVAGCVRADPDSTAVLFEAASLASWLIYRLWSGDRPRVMLDIGRAIDVWYPDVIRSQWWFKRSGGRIVRKMGLESLHRR